MRQISQLGLEDAIAAVEDEIARMPRSAIPDTLQTSDARIRALASGADTLTLEAVEQAFQRLAARGLPAEREAAATIVILRELMHHLRVKAVRLA